MKKAFYVKKVSEKRYGCIGKKLAHSFSKEIHAQLADYDYELIELAEEELAPFLEEKNFAAINVTIPYKEAVIPYLDSLSDVAARIGAVNIVVNREGKLFGDNSDYAGLKALIDRVGVSLVQKKVLVLGTGGASKTACIVAEDLGAVEILRVSRRKKLGSVTYEEALAEHTDAHVIINTTPVGMFPDCDAQPLDIESFSQLEGVIDAIYNPLRTNLVLSARERGILAEGGLYMLVAQAVAAVEAFLGTPIPHETTERIYARILSSKENIVLTGMPGSGKSTVGACLASDMVCRAEVLSGYEFFDTDSEIEKLCDVSIKELIETRGEEYFRNLETKVIAEVSSQHSRIISTGGGAVLREENVRALKRNGRLFFLDADIRRLQATQSRPLANTYEKLKKLYEQRLETYKTTADAVVPDMETPQALADAVIEKRKEPIA